MRMKKPVRCLEADYEGWQGKPACPPELKHNTSGMRPGSCPFRSGDEGHGTKGAAEVLQKLVNQRPERSWASSEPQPREHPCWNRDFDRQTPIQQQKAKVCTPTD